MIQGTVINNGVNAGSQAGVVVTGGTFVAGHFARTPLISGLVVNNGFNFGSQAGVVIQGGRFFQF